MADIDYNAVLSGEYTPRVGDRYELSPGNWGTMPAPTIGLQERVTKMAEEGASDLQVAKAVLTGLKDFSDENAIFGMAQAVIKDFFTIVSGIVAKLTAGSDLSDLQSQETKA